MKLNNILIFVLALLVIAPLVSAYVGGGLIYTSTSSNSLSINSGDSTNIIISADSAMSNSMHLFIGVYNNAGNLVGIVLNELTYEEGIYRQYTINPSHYIASGDYEIRTIVTGSSGETSSDV